MGWFSIEAAFWLSLFASPLGCLLFFRRLSFFGDALAHSAFSGVALVYILLGGAMAAVSAGSLLAVLLCSALLFLFEKRWKLPSDVSLTLSYSGLFALGWILMTYSPIPLERLLFGDILHLSADRLWFLRIWGVFCLLLLLRFWRAIWMSVLDPLLAKTLGWGGRDLEFVFTVVTAISVVGMIQAVGVVLVTSYLILPAATALPWVRSIRALVTASIAFSFAASLIGMSIPPWVDERIPVGPSIAVVAFVLCILSYLLREVFGALRNRSLR